MISFCVLKRLVNIAGRTGKDYGYDGKHLPVKNVIVMVAKKTENFPSFFRFFIEAW